MSPALAALIQAIVENNDINVYVHLADVSDVSEREDAHRLIHLAHFAPNPCCRFGDDTHFVLGPEGLAPDDSRGGN